MGAPIPSLAFIRDRDIHMQRRKYWLRGLNTAAIKEYEPIFEKRVKQLVGLLGDSEGSTANLSQLLRYFSYVL